jgi:hypothetical protein
MLAQLRDIGGHPVHDDALHASLSRRERNPDPDSAMPVVSGARSPRTLGRRRKMSEMEPEPH